MPSGTFRSTLIFLLLSFITLPGLLTAQEPGSFDAEVDRFLKSGQISKKSIQADSRDSVLISAALSSGKRFRSINRDSCLFYLHKAINISLKSGSPGFVSDSFHELGDYYLSREMYSEAMSCYLKSLRIEEALQQNEIFSLTRQRKNTYIYLLLGIILILIWATSNHLRILKKNKLISEKDIQIREEKILDLQKEQQLLASRSVLDGEEAERLRIATDLHNGLGSLLTGIKLNLSSMKENIDMTQDNVNAFSHAISLLDTSIGELRRIAHNLMPETLNQFGLKTALEDFCTQVSSAKHVLVLQFFGEDLRYSKEFELSIYRISQELINNALKHSGADRINVQLISERKRICVQVNDNGVGFNPEIYMKNGYGKGIRNIRNKITVLNGRFDIWSQPGKGAEMSVEIDIPQI
jgi:two-component system, NarL family, sensor kinase